MTWIRDALSGEINKADETGGNGSAEVRADETSRCSLAGDAAPAGFCLSAMQLRSHSRWFPDEKKTGAGGGIRPGCFDSWEEWSGLFVRGVCFFV